jgi:hypothetical protein
LPVRQRLTVLGPERRQLRQIGKVDLRKRRTDAGHRRRAPWTAEYKRQRDSGENNE